MLTDDGDEFILKTYHGYFHFKILEVFGFPESTCHWGGYDTRSSIEIKSPGYSLQGSLSISTGELFNFYVQLKNCHETLSGTATLSSYEKNLQMDAIFDGMGNIAIKGSYVPYHDANELIFDLSCDQSYIPQALEGLNKIVSIYGDNEGKRGVDK